MSTLPPGPPRLEIVPITVPLEVFRIVGSDDVDDPELLEAFKSNHDRGRPMRRRSPEETYRAIWQGISVFDSARAAAKMAHAWPRLGDYIAHLILHPGAGFSVASWGSPGHMSAWGDPAAFRSAIRGIVAVNSIDVGTP